MKWKVKGYTELERSLIGHGRRREISYANVRLTLAGIRKFRRRVFSGN